ncbi:MAG TPA: hypothetical protein VKY19_17675 [Ktedonosporobacter sp.]|jgi:hypothetical protein|nr:hypothetical protein [Ktedonosporobacter sp.]
MQTFYVNQTNNTSADTLLTLGWAALLQEVCNRLGRPDITIVLRQQRGSYEITLSHPLREEQLNCDQWIALLDPLISAKQDERQAKKGRTLQDGFRYDEEREKQKQLAEQRKHLEPRLRTPDAFWRNEPELEKLRKIAPRPELAHYQAINMMKVPDTFNEIVLRWQALTGQQQWLTIALLCRLFSQEQNDIEAACKAWENLAKEQGIERKTMVTAVQVINPTTGKGSNTPKSDHLTSAGLDSFWLLELLKFKGFMLGAAPYVLKGSKDRKTYVIQPATVELGTLARMMDQFRQICWSSTAIKQDIFAALRLTQVLVKHRQTQLSSRQGLEAWEEGPIVSIASGFDVAFYKDMGSAHATMNVSTINVPTWFPQLDTLQATEDAELFLQEHLRIIRRIEGHQGKEGNDELELLRTYRDFLSGHDLNPFWTFAASYGNYLFRQRDHEKNVLRWLPQLTKKGLDFLIMQSNHDDLRTITQNRGFQRIASAIREATVRAQRRTSQENDNRYEVRYGLGQELIRKARYRDDFMNALNKFLFLYNEETAREEEKVAKQLQRRLQREDYHKYRLRFPVTTADIDQLEDLLDRYPTELIAKKLVAYGYARLEQLSAEELQSDVVENEPEMSTAE